MTNRSVFDRGVLLRSLSCAFGVSGDEGEVMQILEQVLQERFSGLKDRFGNRVFSKSSGGGGPHVLIAAHADEVGFMVQAIHPQGVLSIVPVGSYEKVMPLKLLPTFLLRALSADDIEESEKLGALELTEEDLALCTFVCPAKIDHGVHLRRILSTIQKEG